MTIKIVKTTYNRKSINRHTEKEFIWKGKLFTVDKETDTFPVAYRLWGSSSSYGFGVFLELDYFCHGADWQTALSFVEGYLFGTYGENNLGKLEV